MRCRVPGQLRADVGQDRSRCRLGDPYRRARLELRAFFATQVVVFRRSRADQPPLRAGTLARRVQLRAGLISRSVDSAAFTAIPARMPAGCPGVSAAVSATVAPPARTTTVASTTSALIPRTRFMVAEVTWSGATRRVLIVAAPPRAKHHGPRVTRQGPAAGVVGPGPVRFCSAR
jgi:hypothetical protein